MTNTQPTGKVQAARNLVQTLDSEFDFELWLDGHPNGETALNRLLDDLEQQPDSYHSHD